ncbi:glycosyltransferase [Fictibacillus aquaticus]|uniref:Glycosyl transferase family 1 n=1 Tax=Fictibacillus aquaticus TaxID=2021314 RepID=A0A235FC56_9BACL|nr:glycosyltransferase [Fictibacillus aquaticus]OYD58365.1 glycosyl transferase family 1 [Fictibacillus aquaticus]
MKKYVLMISDHGDPLAKLGGSQAGGQNNYVHQLALSLENRGWTVDVATHWCDKNVPQVEAFGERSRVIRIAAGYKGFVSKNELFEMMPAFFKEMEEILPLDQYDLIHSHYWISGILARQFRRKYDIPFIHTSHSLGIARQKATGVADERRLSYEKGILRSANRVIATTQNEKSLIHEFVKQPAPVDIIPIGVSSLFKPYPHKSVRSQLGLHGPSIVYAGRLEETKGVKTLLNAFRHLVRVGDLPDSTKLYLIGGDEDQIDSRGLPVNEEYRSLVKGIEQRVSFLGPKNQEELALYFSAATCSVVPSYYESFGMVAAEAQACGCPVIASRVGGLQDVVAEGETGLLVRPNDEEDLALTLEILLQNELIASRLGKQAARFADQVYRWPAIAQKIEKSYKEVLSHAAKKRFTSTSY